MAIFREIKEKSKEVQQNPLFFWVSLILLNVLLVLPEVLLYSGKVTWLPFPPLNAPRGWYDTVLFFFRRTNPDIYRLSAEYAIIVSLLYLLVRYRKNRWLERFLIGSYIFFLIYNFYDNLMIRLFGESPIIYNDLLLLKGAFYLLIDISLTSKIIEMTGMILLAILLLALIPFLFRGVTAGLEQHRNSGKLIVSFGVLWIFLISYTAWFKFHDFRAVIKWTTPKIIENAEKSLQLYSFLSGVKKTGIDSTYFSYRDVMLKKHPDIYIFMVESYGRILVDRPELRDSFLDFAATIEDTLVDEGWHARSTFSTSPITGGRSWLSMGSLINGMHMKYEAIYSYFLNKIENYPNLVSFMNHQGYHTFALQPLNRERPGYSMTSYEKFYQYQTYVNFGDLDFDGPAFGFRNIPDQYSLNYTREKFLQKSDKPVFLFFLTVSSHSPWIDLPPYVDNWVDLKNLASGRIEDKYGRTEDKIRETISSHFSSGIGWKDYLQHMKYELKVIRDFILEKAGEHSVVIVLGDHQPPIVNDENASFDTPLHIISRDTSLLNRFEDYGFREGLFPPASSLTPMRHEGIYSLLVHVLVQEYGMKGANLPEYKPEGVHYFRSGRSDVR